MYFKCITNPENHIVRSVTFFGRRDFFFFTLWI